MDTPGFITPPPNLIPPRHDTGTQTQRAPSRKRELPAFLPPTAPKSAQPTVKPTSWRLTLPDGTQVTIAGAVLLGRDPVHVEPWAAATLLKLDDPAKTVSKTHAAIAVDGDAVTVTDLHSTNGVFVMPPAGDEIAVKPGESATVAAGASVDLGRYTILVDQA